MDKIVFRKCFKLLVTLKHALKAAQKAEADVWEIMRTIDADDPEKDDLEIYAAGIVARINTDMSQMEKDIRKIIDSCSENHEEEVKQAIILASRAEVRLEGEE